MTALAVIGLALLTSSLLAGPPKVVPAGERPDDARLGELKNLNGSHPFHDVDSAEAWKKRKKALRRRAKVALGLWPQWPKTPLEPVIHGKVERQDYTVEKVYFQSVPGHFVTGNLYRPKGTSGKVPGVLCPHGHWPNGRFTDRGADTVRKKIQRGAERFKVGGRYPTQARCVQLARMGCVVFHYDMIGYADSKQLEHRPGVREAMNREKGWGFFSPQAELRLQTMMGMQTWNSIRSLDFLRGLDQVDADRIGVTGASGGGTQTFILGAVDPRPDALFPVNMVSTAMQGGCTCENASYLRIGAGNVDLAALAAPRPLGLTSADDWTKELESKGYPDLKRLYEMLGHPDRLQASFLTHFPHNYNYVTREVMYQFMNKHLSLGLETPVLEGDYDAMSAGGLSVWNEDHPAPSGDQVGASHERSLLKYLTEVSRKQMKELIPEGKKELAEYRRVVGGAADVLIGRDVPKPTAIEYEAKHEAKKSGYTEMAGLLRHKPKGEVLPTLYLMPSEWDGRVAIWLHPDGKAGVLKPDGSPRPPIRRLLDSGVSVAAVDLLYQGEFLPNKERLKKTRLWYKGDGEAAWHKYAGYTFGYNYPVFSKRVHDVLTVISFVVHHDRSPKQVALVGLAGAGHWAAAARAQAREAVDRCYVHTNGFRFASVQRFDHPDFLPGGAKYHDLPGLLALSSPSPLWVAGEGEKPPAVLASCYEAAGARDRLQVASPDDPASAVVSRLTD